MELSPLLPLELLLPCGGGRRGAGGSSAGRRGVISDGLWGRKPVSPSLPSLQSSVARDSARQPVPQSRVLPAPGVGSAAGAAERFSLLLLPPARSKTPSVRFGDPKPFLSLGLFLAPERRRQRAALVTAAAWAMLGERRSCSHQKRKTRFLLQKMERVLPNRVTFPSLTPRKVLPSRTAGKASSCLSYQIFLHGKQKTGRHQPRTQPAHPPAQPLPPSAGSWVPRSLSPPLNRPLAIPPCLP